MELRQVNDFWYQIIQPIRCFATLPKIRIGWLPRNSVGRDTGVDYWGVWGCDTLQSLQKTENSGKTQIVIRAKFVKVM